jgi:hypothetical protein
MAAGPGASILRTNVADLPIDLGAEGSELLASVLDVEGKIPQALEALGPVGDRDVILVDSPSGMRARQLSELGARVTLVDSSGPARFDAPDDSADVVVACWSAFRGAPADELTEADRLLRPGGRLLVVQDYGRDDVSRLLGEQEAYGTWTRRGGPFLGNGFKIRVIHCWWTFESLESARRFLGGAFGDAGRTVGAALTRPRLTYNVAVYHRSAPAAS